MAPPTLNPATGAWNISYQYFGGISVWLDPIYNGPSCSLVKLALAKSTWALAADFVARIDGQWAGFGGSQFDAKSEFEVGPPQVVELLLDAKVGNLTRS